MCFLGTRIKGIFTNFLKFWETFPNFRKIGKNGGNWENWEKSGNRFGRYPGLGGDRD